MKASILFALLIAVPALAGPGNDDTKAIGARSGHLVIADDSARVEQCIADCAAAQRVCAEQCLGNGQCFANCMTERDYCVAQCRSR